MRIRDRRPALESHLATCSACRTFADAAVLQHADLHRAFAPQRADAQALADRVIAQLPGRAPVRSRRTIPWLPMILSAAAGFAIAFVTLRSKPTPTTLPPASTRPTTSTSWL